MTSSGTPSGLAPLDQLLTLEAKARAASTLTELVFSIANDSFAALGFRQALVFASGKGLLAISGLVRPEEDSPYLVWLRRAWPWLHECAQAQPGWFEPGLAPQSPPSGVTEGWEEWWPRGLYALPLRRRDGSELGWACFLLEAPPTPAQGWLLARLGETWSYCWEMLAGKPRASWRPRWLTHGRKRLALLLLPLALLLPVRQTVLAPAEVMAMDAEVVAAPLDGVVKSIHVRPNEMVAKGNLLFSLDDITLRNRLEVAQKSVAVADAELQAATQKAFDNLQSKAELALLNGRAQEKRAELSAVQTQLARIDVTASRDGVAVFGDPDDWLGRPVVTGERIMQLADPGKPGVLVHLPVADAITLEPGAELRLFLTVQPLSPLSARLTETSYQATLSPDNVASYRLRGAFGNAQERARIGLRGTAKLYGGWVTLGYYLFRRPVAALREWSGL
ncbi:efflux RND transporter periplasmic adaptor subunit [Azomonas macrocytogenes]|uniref:Multidrug efflux pump subunit AcrA (Membrane-fusion protein) n=1 Tax=Azomonas macrocytogenes TaxID=69962 RepID=A0A839T3E0_AZOMA|nr:biotin/lipoyl-binding protein [Azomonas macrocytogenes]MBB3102253.1 multidrug efflux pump subunit AcrA (membrane-fusion protein) [Azomonas macrocytogenes]